MYQIIVDDPEKVAKAVKQAQPNVREFRKTKGDSYHFNWSMKIAPDFQQPFEPTHQSMGDLNLDLARPKADLASDLRRAFSGIVAGNVKAEGINQIRKDGPFHIKGDQRLMKMMDELLESFVEQQRMKLPGSEYIPCYKVITENP